MKAIALTLMTAFVCTTAPAAGSKEAFTDTFAVDKADLASAGTNRFFILAPRFQSVLEGEEGGKHIVLTITVLNETRLVDGVETRIVEERETADGQPVEISRNYFAISRRTGDVFYFGEDVDMYRDGKVTSHDGAWLSGVGGARFGLQMPGTPLLGARYYQEVAPKVAMDRAEVKSLGDKLETPAGRFENCLNTDETSALESAREVKIYAPGIGLVFDGALKLTKHGYTSQ
ncbi:MAG: hypothetical protein PHY43_02305 [Verrucomicrobiales bacterium]|nr:hypothetical protein [Verrucomicrobiales bacterium]